jgi:hypothetical protein
MKRAQLLSAALVMILSISCGCLGQQSHGGTADQTPEIQTGHPTHTGPPASGSPMPYTTGITLGPPREIPLLLTDTDKKTAEECGWTEDNMTETRELLLGSCEVGRLLSDGWAIEGIGYDMNFLGSRCRKTTHPDAPVTCDWCADAGPTLVLTYRGVTTEYLANLNEKTVTGFKTYLPEDTVSVSTGDSEIIRFRNGTVLYTFRTC